MVSSSTARVKRPLSETISRVRDFLRGHPVGVLTTVHVDGGPYATVVYFSVDNELNIFFTTKRNTKKHENIKRNSEVAMVSYEAFSQTMVQVSGRVVEATDAAEIKKAFKEMVRASIRTSINDVPPISRLYAGYYVVYKLSPKQINMATFSYPVSENSNMFETVEFGSR